MDVLSHGALLQGGRHEAAYSFATDRQASHTGTKELGCHLVDAAAVDRNGLDQRLHEAYVTRETQQPVFQDAGIQAAK